MDPQRTEKLNPSLRLAWSELDSRWIAYFVGDPQRTATGETREEAAGRLLMFIPEQDRHNDLVDEVLALREIVRQYADFAYIHCPVDDPFRIRIEQEISKANTGLWLRIQQHRPGKPEHVVSAVEENGDE